MPRAVTKTTWRKVRKYTNEELVERIKYLGGDYSPDTEFDRIGKIAVFGSGLVGSGLMRRLTRLDAIRDVELLYACMVEYHDRCRKAGRSIAVDKYRCVGMRVEE